MNDNYTGFVGDFTGRYTASGRPIFLTPSGEFVSEKSLTVPFGDGFANVPSIHDGIMFREKDIVNMLNLGVISPTSVHKSLDEAVAEAIARSSNLLGDY
jgi:hypothetical protein